MRRGRRGMRRREVLRRKRKLRGEGASKCRDSENDGKSSRMIFLFVDFKGPD